MSRVENISSEKYCPKMFSQFRLSMLKRKRLVNDLGNGNAFLFLKLGRHDLHSDRHALDEVYIICAAISHIDIGNDRKEENKTYIVGG